MTDGQVTVCLEGFAEALGYLPLLGSYLDSPVEGNVSLLEPKACSQPRIIPRAAGLLLSRSAYSSGTSSRAIPHPISGVVTTCPQARVPSDLGVQTYRTAVSSPSIEAGRCFLLDAPFPCPAPQHMGTGTTPWSCSPQRPYQQPSARHLPNARHVFVEWPNGSFGLGKAPAWSRRFFLGCADRARCCTRTSRNASLRLVLGPDPAPHLLCSV